MALTKFNNLTTLTRTRTGINLIEADVLIAKGEESANPFTLASLSALTAYLANMETLGINAKDSPQTKTEDITEEYDYETESTGVKHSGDIMLKKVNADLIDFIDTDLKNVVVSVMIIPKDRTGIGLLISGIKLTVKTDGKANTDTSSTVTLSYSRRAETIGEVLKYFNIPTT